MSCDAEGCDDPKTSEVECESVLCRKDGKWHTHQVCHFHGGEDLPSCAACDTRLAVVAVRRLDDVALHVTRTEPWGEDARCIECVLDAVTRLVVPS